MWKERFLSQKALSAAAPFAVEWFLCLCDVWSALSIHGTMVNLRIIMGIDATALQWEDRIQLLSFGGAATLIVGLSFLRSPPLRRYSSAIRAVGLAISATVWSAIGLTLLVASGDGTIGGGPFVLMAILAFGMILRWPPTP